MKKNEMRWAGMFACLAFLLVGVGGYMTTFNALQSILYGIVASFVLGFLGYKIGEILAHPRGNRKSKTNLHSNTGDSPLMTGEESLLEEIGSP